MKEGAYWSCLWEYKVSRIDMTDDAAWNDDLWASLEDPGSCSSCNWHTIVLDAI